MMGSNVMGYKELELLTEINKKFQTVIEDMNKVVNDLAHLSKMVYENKMFQLENEDNHEIKLRSYMQF